ncbi:MAG TPA: lysophospholipid acyltransferase family protein [Alkalispirochaeta sp.]|nr:lysophospholipid acyltransferase family protein [Alkalispirochaeta sp.]
MNTERQQKRRKRRDRRRERRRSRPNRPAVRVLRFLVYLLLKNLFNVKPENLDVINRDNGPLVLLGNHSSVIDPFIVAMFIRRPVQYVISDSQIRSRFLSFLLGLVGVIPKTKVVADLDTVKRIVAVKRESGIIGIFPEGQSSWDGSELPIVKATDKLVKSLKVPVYVAQIRGAYFSWPRWGRRIRRGEIRIFFNRLFTEEDLKEATVEAVHDAIRDALSFDAFFYQRQAQVRFRGARQAEYLERALFICPACAQIGTLHSHRRRLTCTSCGYSVHFTPYGFFEARSGALRFETIRDWNVWQLQEFRNHLDRILAGEDSATHGGPVLTEAAVAVQEGYKALPLQTLGTGRLEFFPQAIYFYPEAGEPWEFPVTEIEGMNVQNNEHLEFYCYNSLYRISSIDPRGNTYKWDAAVRHVQQRASLTPSSVV